MEKLVRLTAIASLLLLFCLPSAFSGHDYRQALSKSILFFEAQRSGYLPRNQRVSWRAHSGLNDGESSGVDLVGGYYDAGDNVKFGLPMAFTVTMMSWSILEYGKQMAATGELKHALAAVKWGTDYFIKAHPQPYVLYGEVGDGKTDHYCWQRPEDMTTDRRAYKIDANNPGSDLAGETAAAMAGASLVFRRKNPAYSATLLRHAYQLFDFADKYRGKYDSSITVAQKYYRSVSGYNDELLWAAAWLFQASNKPYYLNYLARNSVSMGGTGWAINEFGWDVKYAGVQTLVAKFLMQGKAGRYKPVFEKYQQKAEFFMCSLLGKGTKNIQKTPGGLIFKQRWNNMQFVTSGSFLATVYSDYLTSHRRYLSCPAGRVAPSQLLGFAKSQVDYILGDNPRATSYMVGYGNNFPRQVHHRGSSIVSIKKDRRFVACRQGYATWFSSKSSDPNLLTGAIVGGPDAYDNFADRRDNYEQTEPATYNNAPLLGILARLSARGRSRQLVSGNPPGILQNEAIDPILDLFKWMIKRLVEWHGLRPTYSTRRLINHFKEIMNWICSFILKNARRIPFIILQREVAATEQKQLPKPTLTQNPVIALEQKLTNTWNSEGTIYHRYSTTLTNRSSKTLNDLKLSISNLKGPIYGLTESGNAYTFPSWINSLPGGKSFEFVYIHSTSEADISVSSYTLA